MSVAGGNHRVSLHKRGEQLSLIPDDKQGISRDGFNLIFASRLCVTAVLRCFFFSLQHTKTSSCLAFSFPTARTVRQLAVREALGWGGLKQQGWARGSCTPERVPGRGQKEGWCTHTSREVSINRERSTGARCCQKSQR